MPHSTPYGRALAVGLLVATTVVWMTASGLATASRNTTGRGTDVVRPGSALGRSSEPKVCAGCKPPLAYGGGPVMSTTGAGITVTPIYWSPAGETFPSGYESIINTYIGNVAAASGSTDNDYSIDTEYYSLSGGAKNYVVYKVHAGAALTDSTPFPSGGCSPDKGYSVCITDAQLQHELKAFLSAHGLPHSLSVIYPVFFPPNVETSDATGSTSASSYCGYHGSYGPAETPTIYANMPYEAGCETGQAPNGNAAADGEISTLTHETAEAITDPIGNSAAWLDSAGNEIGDECAWIFGRPLGHTDPSNPSGSEYNVVIGGGKYYIQELFSNLAYKSFGLDKGCTASQALAEHPSASGTGSGATTVTYFLSDATPTTLPADGKSTSKIVAIVGDQHNFAVQGDHVHFTTGVESGSGVCGTLSSSDAVSDSNGYATVTYTASTSNVTCWVLAVDAEGGLAAEAVLYQGTTQKDSPGLTASFPASMKAGQQTTFSMKESNPSSKPVPDVNISFQIFKGASNSPTLKASQVQLSYSTGGPNGTYTNVPLSGSTADGNTINGTIGAAAGAPLAAGSTPLTFHATVDRGVPLSSSTPLLAFEGYMDQVNSASGSGATLADSYATNITVATEAPSSSLPAWSWWVIAAAVVIAIAALALLLRSRRRKGADDAVSAA